MHPHSRMCDDVTTFDFLLIIISSNLTEKRSVYLRNAFDPRLDIDKLTIIASQILVHQMFFVKCWLAHPSDKNGLNKNCFIPQYYWYKQLVPTL